jgi:signal transduction histidine kinase
VDALGGQCQIDSTLGEGTTLRITLPEPKATALAAQAPAASTEATATA